MAGFGPSPDWNTKTVAWAGVGLDGSPLSGTLTLTINISAPLLDDDPNLPVSVYALNITKEIATTTVMVGGQSRTVGYAEFQVPASNDPDIGNLGSNPVTYTYREDLRGGAQGQTRTVFIDKDAAEPVWLNEMSTVDPQPGEPISAVSRAEFDALVAVVQAGGGNGGGTTLTSYAQVSGLPDYPPAFTPSLHSHPTSQITGLDSQLQGKASTSHTHTATQITDFVEAVQDGVAALLQGASGVTLTYNDAAGQLFISGGSTGTTVDAETIRDTIGVAMIGAGMVSVVVNDAADTITIQGSQALTDALAARLRVDAAQTLSSAQRTQAKENLGLSGFTIAGARTATDPILTDAQALALYGEGAFFTVDPA